MLIEPYAVFILFWTLGVLMGILGTLAYKDHNND